MRSAHIDVIHGLEHHVLLGLVEFPEAEFIAPAGHVGDHFGLLLIGEVLVPEDIGLPLVGVLLGLAGNLRKGIVAVVLQHGLGIPSFTVVRREEALVLVRSDVTQDPVHHAGKFLAHTVGGSAAPLGELDIHSHICMGGRIRPMVNLGFHRSLPLIAGRGKHDSCREGQKIYNSFH